MDLVKLKSKHISCAQACEFNQSQGLISTSWIYKVFSAYTPKNISGKKCKGLKEFWYTHDSSIV